MFEKEDLLGLKSVVEWPYLLQTLRFQKINVRTKRCCCLLHGGNNETAFSWNGDFFHCFSCLKSGDAIELVRNIRGICFVEAVRFLADLFGFRMQWISSGAEKNESEDREIPQYIQNTFLNQDYGKIQIEEKIRAIQKEQEKLTDILVEMRKERGKYDDFCDDIEQRLSDLDGDLSYYFFQKKH